MAITKNSNAAFGSKSDAPKVAPKKVAPPPSKPAEKKPVPKPPAPAPAPKAAPSTTGTESAPSVPAVEKISRKEIAAAIRAKVMATGMAISPKVAEVVSVAYEEVVQEALVAGKQVVLIGFGVFSTSARPASIRPNPQKPGTTVNVPACRVAKFKVGSGLKKAINDGKDVPEIGEDSDEAIPEEATPEGPAIEGSEPTL